MNYYEGLTEDYPIGELFQHGDSILIPFLCCEQRFVASYAPLQGTEYAEAVRGIVLDETGHNVSADAHSLKFGEIEAFLRADIRQYEPPALPPRLRMQIMYRIPERIFDATAKMCEHTAADEFFFTAGGLTEERTAQLNLWYQRLSDRFTTRFSGRIDTASTRFTKIHHDGGEWYGYRKA